MGDTSLVAFHKCNDLERTLSLLDPCERWASSGALKDPDQKHIWIRESFEETAPYSCPSSLSPSVYFP